jgi:2-methylcitrate dehydratase PrpD
MNGKMRRCERRTVNTVESAENKARKKREKRRTVRNEVSIRRKDGAGEVETFLQVDGTAGERRREAKRADQEEKTEKEGLARPFLPLKGVLCGSVGSDCPPRST